MNGSERIPETYPAVVCGQRETRTDGQWECVRPAPHPAHPCYMVKLVRRVAS